MTAIEITTAARACLPVKFFVSDDRAYHLMQVLQKPAYHRTNATVLAHLDYEALAHGFGVAYNEIGGTAEVEGGIHNALATPGPVLTRVVTDYGKPLSAAGFGGWFRARCNEAGLPKRCTSHGLRKAACRRLAEAGCSANVIASISGHTTLREVERYTRAADQKRMARMGMAAMITGRNTG